MKVLLTTCNTSYIHKNLALRWLYVCKDPQHTTILKEYTLKQQPDLMIEETCLLNPDVVALSVYIWNSEVTQYWISTLKKINPAIIIMVGGPEVTYKAEYWLDMGADIVFKGEGEQIFWQAINGNTSLPGIATKNNVNTPVVITDLDWLSQQGNPYFLDFDQSTQANQYLYLETSRGCPFQCSYCLSAAEEGIRIFPLKYVLDQLDRIESSQIKQVKFLDRTFNLFAQRALTIAQRCNDIQRDITIQFECEVTALDQKLEDFFIFQAKTNRFRFEIGVQSFHLPTLKAVKRHQDNHQVQRIIRQWSQAGHIVHADLIAGLPYEDYHQFLDSFLQLFITYPQEIQVGVLKILPGTPLHQQAKHLGYRYQQNPPYTIIDNPWISQIDMSNIHFLALATDKTYNHQRCLTLYKECILKDIPLENRLVELGRRISLFAHPYQNNDIYYSVVDVFKDDFDTLLIQAMILQDVVENVRKKPSYLFDFNVSSHVRHKIMEDIYHRNQISTSDGKRKTWMHYGYINQAIVVQCILYNDTMMKRTYYTLEGEYIDESAAISYRHQ